MKHIFRPIALTLLFCCIGCLNFSYDGDSNSGKSDAIFLEESDERSYTVLGTAQVAGDYATFSLDEIKKRLKRGADEVGADGIVIRSIQVVSKGSAVQYDPAFEATRATTGSGLSERMATEFDIEYGNARNRNADQNSGTAYRRIVVADFVSFSDAEAK